MAPFLTARADAVRISVDKTLCTGCGICEYVCPTDVFEMEGLGRSHLPDPVRVEDCIDCGTCELSCPDFALEVAADG
ncbi:MAG: ferredoxin family protein [Halodesulfurarchaeum sp.]